MKLNFRTAKAYQTAKTLLGGNDYKFAYYIDELSMRFFTRGSFVSAVSALSEIGVCRNHDYEVDDYEFRLPALENGYSVG